MEVDSNALGELLSHIRIAHHGHPRSPDFQQVLDQTENLLDTKRWEEHHQKQQFIFYLEEPADEASCRRFASEVDLHEVTDPGFLAMILGYREDLSVAERLGIIDQIVDRSTDWELKVRFLCYKGLLWELHGDSKEAEKNLLAAIDVVPDDEEPEWGHAFIVKAFALAGNHTSDSSLIQDGIKRATKYLNYIDTNAPHLELELRKSRATAFKYLGDGAKAVDDLKWVVDKRGSYDDRIQLAQAYIAGQEFTPARQLLQDIPYGDLTAGEKYDHTYAMFGLLYGTGNSDLEETVKRRLLELEPEFPYWREARSSLLEMLLTKDENESLPSWWLSFREMVILEPNFFGLGIDLSAVIERFFLERN